MQIVACLFSAIGGLLFGLDLGYMSGILAMASFHHDVNGDEPLDDATAGAVTAVFSLGAILSSLPPVAGAVVDGLGRKGAICLGALLFSAGAFLQGVAHGLRLIYAGRIVSGAAIGLLSVNVPLYQGELAQPRLRGSMVALYQLAITAGIMIAFWLNYAVERAPGGWRISVLCQLLPGVALALGMWLLLPQSPRWLVSVGRITEATAALARVRGPADDVHSEIQSISDAFAQEMASGEPSWAEFSSGAMRRRAAIGVCLQLLQQLCGMNAFMYYGPRIFSKLGSDAFLFTALAGVVNFLSTLPAIVLIDRAGRTALLRYSALGMGASCVALAVIGDTCIGSARCAYVAATAVFTFIFSFAFGWGPVVWVYCAELFPLKYRSKAAGLTTAANWIGNSCIGFFPPLLISAIGFDTFWVFGAFCALCFAAACRLPETRNRSLEEVATACVAVKSV
jgi:sugar porter (SP) family MFS transporter